MTSQRVGVSDRQTIRDLNRSNTKDPAVKTLDRMFLTVGTIETSEQSAGVTLGS